MIADSFSKEETADSLASRGHEAFDSDWVRYVFTAWAACGNSRCKQPMAIIGKGRVTMVDDDNRGHAYEDYFQPLLCHPMPDILYLPEETPENIRDELRAAFTLFWTQAAACAGRLRVALELLLDHLKIPKRKKLEGGKFKSLTLHDRIQCFGKNEPALGTQFMALKWLGNSGSHDRDVRSGDVLDGFAIMEYAIEEIIGRRTATLTKLVTTLTKKHKPKPKRRK